MADASEKLGSKLGPRLAELLVDAHVSALHRTHDARHRLSVHSARTVIDWMGHEFGDVMAPIADEILRTQELPDPVRKVMTNMTSGKHQWQALAGIAFGGSGIMSALGTIMNNYLAPLTYQSVAANPLVVPDPATVAQLMARGMIDSGYFTYAMSGQGLNAVWADAMVEGARTWPDLATMLQLLRMGLLTGDQVAEILGRAGMPSYYAQLVTATHVTPLSVPDAALGLLRGAIDRGRAEEAARLSGVSSADLDVIVANTGEPPAVEALLQLWRRGAVGDAELEKGIRQSRVRDEWIPAIKQLGIMPPTGAEVVNALVTGQTDMATAERRFAEAGGDPSWFTTAWHAGGESPTPTQLGVLANRGLIPWKGAGPDSVSYEQGFKESRFKNKWLPYYKQLAVYLPPPRTVTALLDSGAISTEEATKLLLDYGMDAQLVAAYTHSSHKVRTATQRHLAVADITALYQDRAIDAGKAEELLTGLGFEQQDALYIIEVADLARARRYASAVISTVHSRYIGHDIDRGTASGMLDTVGIPATERDELLTLWDLEWSVRTRRLTEAQVISAFKKAILTQAQAHDYLINLGYTESDAIILLKISGDYREPTAPTVPPAAG